MPFAMSGALASARAVVPALMAVLPLLAGATAAHAQAPVQWSTADGGNGQWYERISTDTEITWAEADAAARATGGHLVTLTSPAEAAWIQGRLIDGHPLCPSLEGEAHAIWLGLRQETAAAETNPAAGWSWVTGEPVVFANWAEGEPDDSYGGENFAGLLPTGAWDDLSQDAAPFCMKGYVIEWSGDCDGDGVVDFGQIAAGELADANGNRIPDCCEGAGTPTDDCNANGEADACELEIDGADTDLDLVLDTCERAFGDLDLDGVVGAGDLALLLESWGMTADGAAGELVGDLDLDGVVGAADLSLLLARWGERAPWELPTIRAVSPANGPAEGGTRIAITGWNLTGATSVEIGEDVATDVVVVDETRILATTPAGPVGPATVIVRTPAGVAELADGFTYQSGSFVLPTITSVTPSAGPTAGGTTITITGTNLTGATSVKVGTVACTGVTVTSATQLTAVTPAGTAGAKTVSVTTPGGSATLSGGFTYLAYPSWGTVLENLPDPAIVTNAALRNAIVATGYPWRVRHNGTQIEMLLIPPGTFNMGCSASNAYGCDAGESPVHSVTLTNAFYLGRYEVTQAQWTAKMGSNPSYFQSASAEVPAAQVPNRPVEQVSWTTIQGFLTATGMRLPTEAEWEYAYRAGTTTAFHGFSGYPSGTNDDALVGNIAWYSANSARQTRPIGGKAANGFGLHDMAGNVYEWVNDWYLGNYYASSPSTNPPGPTSGTNRVLRGGVWGLGTSLLRSSDRYGYAPSIASTQGGFRVARAPASDPPALTGISPNAGPTTGGTPVTITGANLTGATSVKFGTTSATGVVVVNDTTITAVTPVGSAGAKSVSVTTPGGTGSLASAFTYFAPPAITTISPTAGPVAGGNTVTINGSGFLGATSVTIGGVAVTSFTITSSTKITTTAPASTPGAKDVVVSGPWGTATKTGGYTYYALPTVASVTPNQGSTTGGTAVTITGTNFLGTTAVKFGSTSATAIVVVNDTTITAVTPAASAGAKSLSVTTPGGIGTLASAFTYFAPPAITSVVPAIGPTTGGTAIAINGSGLLGATSVTIGGVAVSAFTITSSSKITTTAPASTAGAKDVVVTGPWGTATRLGGYTYVLPPTIASVSPNQGPTAGGTPITITGANLTGATSVKIGTASATSVVVVNDTTITAVTPAAGAGAKSVSVTTPGGTLSVASAFTYFAPPAITTIVPAAGPLAGGNTVTINGSGFLGATSVTIGGVAVSSFTVTSSSKITTTAPASTAGAKDVVVSGPWGTATKTGGYTYMPPPAVASVTPNQGPTTGGTAVTITGTNLTGATSVKFGSTSATGVVVVNGTTITAVTPAGSAGAKSVSVTTPAGTATLASAFTFVSAPTITSVTPSAGPIAGGTTITIVGTNLTGASAVTVGGVAATSFSVTSATSMTAVTPASAAGAKSVSVTTPGGSATLPGGFTYLIYPSWGTVLENLPDPAIVTNATLRNAIAATGFPWRVRDNGTQIEMVLIPPGIFNMGCSASNAWGCDSDESPVHAVTLTNAFYLGRYEVTQAQWTAKMGSNPSWFQNASPEVPATQVPNRPVEQVSWTTVQGFLMSTGMRLPTEAEWEYAYRAGTTTAFHGFSGNPGGTNDDALVGNIAWFNTNAVNQTRPVGGKAANGFGLHDMAGNVMEWVNDWYGLNYYASSPSTNPLGPTSGSNRVLRGGSWIIITLWLRSSDRDFSAPGNTLYNTGFRVARAPL